MMHSVERKLSRPLSVVAVLLLTVVACAAAQAQGQAPTGPTDYDCETAWKFCSASDTCGQDTSSGDDEIYQASVDTSSYTVNVNSSGQCYVEVSCLRASHDLAPTSNTFTGTTDEVTRLHNCDGTLREGGCYWN